MRICVNLFALLLAASAAAWSGDIYQSNSIWMTLEQIDQLPAEGYALKVVEQTDARRVMEGYQDGSPAVTIIREREGGLTVETQKMPAEDSQTVRTYRDTMLISESAVSPEGTELTEFEYDPSGELETVRTWRDDELEHEQLFFRSSDGSLRSVYRFADDQFLQMVTLRDRGFSVGTDERTVSESWDNDRYIREIFRGDELVFLREEGSEFLLERDYRADSSLEKHYEGDAVVFEKRSSGSRSTEIRYSYDEQRRLTAEDFTETTPQQQEVNRQYIYTYHREGWLEETRRYMNDELREVSLHDRDGSIIQREIYRGGRKLLTYTYD